MFPSLPCAAISSAAIAADSPSDLNASGAGYEQRIVPANSAPNGVVITKTTDSYKQPVQNSNQRDKSSD